MNDETREYLQDEIEQNRRSERRLIPLAFVSLSIVSVLVVIRLVYFGS